MLVGVMSDSHDNVPMIRRAVGLFSDEGAEVLIHAGDFVAPFAAKAVMEFPGNVIAVFGNNDGEKEGLKKVVGDVEDPPRRFELGGLRFMLTHDLAKLPGEEMGSWDVAIYGHDHEVSVGSGDPPCGGLMINPGECGAWLTGKATVVLVDTVRRTAEIRELR